MNPPTDPRRALGARGEALAARHLEAHGYRILARNPRAGGVELDLVARRGPTVVFVEVKTRRSDRFGAPELAVDAAKRARLVRGAQAWLAEQRVRARRIRFDVIAIAWPAQGSVSLEHLEAAFDADD